MIIKPDIRITDMVAAAAIVSLIYQTAVFVKETKALPSKVATTHTEASLALVKIDRGNINMEHLCNKLGVRPEPKSDTEKQLEETLAHRLVNYTEAPDE